MDETKHYEKIAARLNYLGAVPTTQPDPIAHSKTTKAMIKDGVEAERPRSSSASRSSTRPSKRRTTLPLIEDVEADEKEHHHAFLTLLK